MTGPRRLTNVQAIVPIPTYPSRMSLNITHDMNDDLDEIRIRENRKLRAKGFEQVYTTSGLIRACIALCLSDPKLRERMARLAAEPRLSGRGHIGHTHKMIVRRRSDDDH